MGRQIAIGNGVIPVVGAVVGVLTLVVAAFAGGYTVGKDSVDSATAASVPLPEPVTRVRNSSLVDYGGYAYGSAIANFRGQYVLVGSIKSTQEGVDYTDGAIWLSDDGFSWRRISHDHEVFGGVPTESGWPARRHMSDLVQLAPDTLVAVGYDTLHGDGTPLPAAWSTENATEWAPIDLGFSRSWFSTGPASFVSVTRAGGSVVGYLGHSTDTGTNDVPSYAVARMDSNRSWSEPADVQGIDGWLEDVTFTSGRYVAVGYTTSSDADGTPDGAIWWSDDGISFQRADIDIAPFRGSGYQQLHGVAESNGYWIIAGVDDTRDRPAWDAAVWVSSDGLAWSRVPHDDSVLGGAGSQYAMSAMYDDKAEVWRVVGHEGADGASELAMWVVNPAG